MNPQQSDFQNFLDQKMNEIRDGVIQNIIRKKQENKKRIQNQTDELDFGSNKIYDTRNDDDREIVNSKFNQMIEDLKKRINSLPPTLTQIKTQNKF